MLRVGHLYSDWASVLGILAKFRSNDLSHKLRVCQGEDSSIAFFAFSSYTVFECCFTNKSISKL